MANVANSAGAGHDFVPGDGNRDIGNLDCELIFPVLYIQVFEKHGVGIVMGDNGLLFFGFKIECSAPRVAEHQAHVELEL